MGDPAGMEVPDRIAQLTEHDLGIRLGEAAAPMEEVEEVPALRQVQHQLQVVWAPQPVPNP